MLVIEAAGEITLVECKLRANPEIRRQVVGQALAYAAALWDLDRAFGRQTGRPLAAALGDKVTDWDEERFRQAVARNLADGALRLVIAVDEITDELKRIVRFLNRHTSSEVELLALELRHAVDQGIEVLIPETYGEESAIAKLPRGRVDGRLVLDAIRTQHPGPPGERMVALYGFMRDSGARLSWGKSSANPSVTAWLGEDVANPVSISFYSQGIAVNFDFLGGQRTVDELARLAELARTIPGAAPHYQRLEQSGYRIRPTLPPEEVLATDDARDAFKRAVVEAAKAATA